jgi:hypothetical protein
MEMEKEMEVTENGPRRSKRQGKKKLMELMVGDEGRGASEWWGMKGEGLEQGRVRKEEGRKEPHSGAWISIPHTSGLRACLRLPAPARRRISARLTPV